jgi:transposase-like protein
MGGMESKMTEGKTRTGKNPTLAAERRRIALELRKEGAGYQAIARQLGLHGPGSAYKIVQAALKATYREPADEVRKLELARLDRLMLALWERARAGEASATDRVLKIMERRSRYLGLDAPEKRDVTSGGQIMPITFMEVVKPPDADASDSDSDNARKSTV